MANKYFIKKNAIIFILLILLSAAFCGNLQADAADGVKWKNFETKFTTIRYQTHESLDLFNRKIQYGSHTLRLNPPFSYSETDTFENIITQKVDNIYQRVQMILDMQRDMKKVTINLYKNRRQLHNAYSEIFAKACRFQAWYIYKKNTIFLNAEDVHEGILAHEIAHSVIDHYLLIRPPFASSEILARYVDSHLRRKNRFSKIINSQRLSDPPGIETYNEDQVQNSDITSCQ